MDLSTKYLGLSLAHPLMPGASPLAHDLDAIRRLEDAGASAIVMHSLFEEQVTAEELAVHHHVRGYEGAHIEALSYFPESSVFAFGPDEYLEHLRKVREAVKIPVIASLNGATVGGWLRYAEAMVQAGAHALELNLYTLATDAAESAEGMEARLASIVREVRKNVRIPIAVKLSPFFSALPHFVFQLEDAGADGVVLFNRFYQPDIDVDALEMKRALELSSSSELRLRLHWIGILADKTRTSLAITGGVHGAIDVVKSIMAGAHAVQMTSALLQRGAPYLRQVIEELTTWMEEHEYASVSQMRGSMSLARCPDPLAYERGNYAAMLQSWARR